MAMVRWLVKRYNKKTGYYQVIDEVYCTKDCDADYVKQSLIEHDHYPVDIIVEKAN